MKDIEFVRHQKYEVMKLDDIGRYLSPAQRYTLADIINTIQSSRGAEGKKPCNNYVVVNEEEPYAEQVWKLIEAQEIKVMSDNRIHLLGDSLHAVLIVAGVLAEDSNPTYPELILAAEDYTKSLEGGN